MSKQFDKQLGTMMRTIRKEKRISIDHVAESLHAFVHRRTLSDTGDVLLSALFRP